MSDNINPSPEGENAPVTPQREPVFNLPSVIVGLIGVCVFIHVARTYWVSEALDLLIIVNFAFFPIRYVPQHFSLDFATLVAPVSHSFLHGSWLHLGVNMGWLAAFGSPLAWRLGAGRILVFWVITAICAVALHTMIYWGDNIPLIGASGAVSGLMGAAARFGFRANRANPRAGFSEAKMSIAQTLSTPHVLTFLLVWMAINFVAGAGLLGFGGDISIAWEAHIGGLVAGFFLIDFIDRDPHLKPRAVIK